MTGPGRYAKAQRLLAVDSHNTDASYGQERTPAQKRRLGPCHFGADRRDRSRHGRSGPAGVT
jgi:hypothetical protein